MNGKIDPVSGGASAHRYNLASSTTIFKTRIQSCPIAMRADIKRSIHFMKNRPRVGGVQTSLSADPRRIRALDAAKLRFPAHCRRKTDHSQRRCELLFPYGTGRSNSNGLLEQMP